MKYEEKQGFKKFEEDKVSSSFLLTSIKVIRGRQEEMKNDEFSNEMRKLRGTIKINKKVPQWSYKVFSSDSNYQQRTDKVYDFMNFDSDFNY
jgi:hypothetical protein